MFPRYSLLPIDITVLGNPIIRQQISLWTTQDIIKGFDITFQCSIEIEKSTETFEDLETAVSPYFTTDSVVLMCSSTLNTRGSSKYSSPELMYAPGHTTSSITHIVDLIIKYTRNHAELSSKIVVFLFPSISTADSSKLHTGSNSKVCSALIDEEFNNNNLHHPKQNIL